MNRLPISADIEPLTETLKRLKPALEHGKLAELNRLRALSRPAPSRITAGTPAGMNTVGILSDRLTILVCKEWYLRHRQRRLNDAAAVYHQHITDIVTSLSLVAPGHAKLLEKVSLLPANATANSFEEAYYGLLNANILMWETQELLYTRDMASVEEDVLRDYIKFFSEPNMLRNAFIAAAETLYWA
jgi:hypothetical protein